MRELSQEARIMLEQYRATMTLPADTKARLLQGIEARWTTGDIPAIDVRELPELASRTGDFVAQLWSAPLAKVGVGLGVAASIGTPLLAETAEETPSAAPSALRIEQAEPPRTIVPAGDEPELAPPPPAPEGAAQQREAHTGGGVDEPQPPRRPARQSKPAESAGEEPTIDAEVQLLKRAQTALNSGRPALALQLLDNHAARFPRSQLGDAREVTRMLALCATGRGAQARQRAARFIRQNPSSPFVDRVRSICALKSP